MPKKKENNQPKIIDNVVKVTRVPKNFDPGKRQDQLVNEATNLAEKQLREGTASAAVIVHYLRLGSAREKEEIANLKATNKLLQAKIQQIHNQEDNEKIAKDALSALKGYSGDPDEENPDVL